MKNVELFKLLGSIDGTYLEEAEEYRSPEARKKARILRWILPVAAVFALITVSVLMVPLFQSSPDVPGTGDNGKLSENVPQQALETVKDEIVYKNYGDHAEITDYVGTGNLVVIPETIDGLPVTQVELMNMNSPGALRIMYNSVMLESIKVSEGQKIVLDVGKDVSEVNLSLVHHSSVEEVLVSSENLNYSSFGGLLYSKDCKTLIACPGGFEKTSLEFNKYNDPQKVGSSTALLAAQLQTIKRDAFRNCSGIQGIVLPDRLQTIERNAFFGCTALRAVTLPSSLETVSYDAFENCAQLQYLSFEGSRTEFLSLHIELPDTLRYSFALEGAIQGEELEKIVSFFEDAEEAASFFSRFNMVACDSGIILDGCYRAADKRFDSEKELAEYLGTIFDADLGAGFSSAFDEHFREIDGKLYARSKYTVATYNADERSYALEKDGEGGYLLTVRSLVPELPYKIYVDSRYTLKEENGTLRFTGRFVLPAESWYNLRLIETDN